MYHSILQLFPKETRSLFEIVAGRAERVNEIRLRAGKPIIVMERSKEWFLNHDGTYTNCMEGAIKPDREVLEKIVQHVCRYSLYAFEEELRQGYITVAGGHRVGMVGQVVTDGENKVKTMKYICGMNIRISHQIKGVAQPVLPWLYKGGRPKSTLIVSPPGCGKTTMLRDIVRQMSDGNIYGRGVTVGVVDERSEICGSYLGQPQNDIGARTDVLDACPKVPGMMMLLRAMSPGIIAIDELGSEAELRALQLAASCGSRVVATMHGEGPEDVLRREKMKECLKEGLFETVILLGKENGSCIIRHIYDVTGNGEWTCRK